MRAWTVCEDGINCVIPGHARQFSQETPRRDDVKVYGWVTAGGDVHLFSTRALAVAALEPEEREMYAEIRANQAKGVRYFNMEDTWDAYWAHAQATRLDEFDVEGA